MNKIKKYIILLSLGAALPVLLFAQGESEQRQTLLLQVTQLNKIGLTNPSVSLVIDKAPAEGELAATTNSDGLLLWTTNGENRKITVASNHTSSHFVLKVLAENVSRQAGTAEPEVTLSDEADHDLILGVSRAAGRCVLKLTAVSSLTEGIGNESRILTYTIMNN